jgi:type IV secretory pathway TrbL component
MDPTILDRISQLMMIALDGAYVVLAQYSIAILGGLGIIHLTLTAAKNLSTGAPFNQGLADLFWACAKIGFWQFIALIFYDLMWNGLFNTFVNWGLAAGGGTFTYDDFTRPSNIIAAGLRIAAPLYDTVNNMGGTIVGKGFWTWAGYVFAYWTITIAFVLMAIHVVMALMEIKMAIAAGAVLMPWGVLPQTAFFCELSLSWITAGLVRVFVTGLIMSIFNGFFTMLLLPGGGSWWGNPDPKIADASIMVAGSIFFAAAAWVVPSRAAGFGGRGMALALSGEHLTGVGTSGWRAMSSAGTAVYNMGGAIYGGRSPLLQRH